MKKLLFIKISSILMICIFSFFFSIESKAVDFGININEGYCTRSYSGGVRRFFVYATNNTYDYYCVNMTSYSPSRLCWFSYTDKLMQNSGFEIVYSPISATQNIKESVWTTTYSNYTYSDVKLFYYSASSPNWGNGNIPSFSGTLQELAQIVSEGLPIVDLGYIQNVGYHVDSYGLENNPIGNNELISWGQYSTTDIDLSNNQYQVEFALRDTSTMVSRDMYQSFLNQFPRLSFSLGPVNLEAMSTLNFTAVTVQHLISNFYPEGDDRRAILRGQAVRTDLHGKVTSLGTYSASSRKASLNCFGAYKRYFADMTDNSGFKDYIDSVGNSASRNDFYNNAKDYFNSFGANYNVSYDIMARIIDTSTGNKGEWISINKHNTPYINSDQSDRLNGGVTCTTGITMGNTTINEGDFVSPQIYAPSYVENEGDTAIYKPTKISVGYVDNSTGDTITNYNNFEYNYGDTFIYNEYPNVGVSTGDDGEIDYTDDGNATENINHALRIFKFIWQKYVTWFNKLFGAWLPPWAKHIVVISLPITFTGIVFKIIKTILPLLGNLTQYLIEVGSGLFLPG